MNQQHIPLKEITEPSRHLHIASLVAHVKPQYVNVVKEWMLQQPQDDINVEIYGESTQGKLIIVTESFEEKAIVNLLDELRAQPKVLSAALVYHEYLSAQDLQDDKRQQEQLLEQQP